LELFGVNLFLDALHRSIEELAFPFFIPDSVQV